MVLFSTSELIRFSVFGYFGIKIQNPEPLPGPRIRKIIKKRKSKILKYLSDPRSHLLHSTTNMKKSWHQTQEWGESQLYRSQFSDSLRNFTSGAL